MSESTAGILGAISQLSERIGTAQEAALKSSESLERIGREFSELVGAFGEFDGEMDRIAELSGMGLEASKRLGDAVGRFKLEG